MTTSKCLNIIGIHNSITFIIVFIIWSVAHIGIRRVGQVPNNLFGWFWCKRHGLKNAKPTTEWALLFAVWWQGRISIRHWSGCCCIATGSHCFACHLTFGTASCFLRFSRVGTNSPGMSGVGKLIWHGNWSRRWAHPPTACLNQNVHLFK